MRDWRPLSPHRHQHPTEPAVCVFQPLWLAWSLCPQGGLAASPLGHGAHCPVLRVEVWRGVSGPGHLPWHRPEAPIPSWSCVPISTLGTGAQDLQSPSASQCPEKAAAVTRPVLAVDGVVELKPPVLPRGFTQCGKHVSGQCSRSGKGAGHCHAGQRGL